VVCMSTLCMLFTLPAQQDLISDILLLGCKSPICHANLLNRGLLAVCSGTFSTLSLHQESQSKFSCLNGEVWLKILYFDYWISQMLEDVGHAWISDFCALVVHVSESSNWSLCRFKAIDVGTDCQLGVGNSIFSWCMGLLPLSLTWMHMNAHQSNLGH
jgi:hypothetical protein